MAWVQLFIDGKTTTAQALKSAESLIERFGALPVSPPPGNMPVITTPEGEYEVRLLSAGMQGFVRSLLEGHFGMTVTREVINPDWWETEDEDPENEDKE